MRLDPSEANKFVAKFPEIEHVLRQSDNDRSVFDLLDRLAHCLPVVRITGQAEYDSAIGIVRLAGEPALEQVRLKILKVAVHHLEVPQRSSLEIMPPGDQRLRWNL